MKLYLKKTQIGLVAPDEIGAESLEKYRNGTLLLCEIAAPRNPKFHDKFFALLRLGFSYWKPGEVDAKHGVPEKNFEQFRKDVIILAGFYESVIRLDGSVRIEPKSISFAKMSEDDFRDVYNKVLNVLLQKIFIGYTDEQVIRMAEEQILSFS
jgi:hypothetical protein